MGEETPPSVLPVRIRFYVHLACRIIYNEIQHGYLLACFSLLLCLPECNMWGEKTAVDEETVRLRSHIAQFRTMLESGEPVGRKLDFLVQEMNRETNTIGSKVQDIEVTRIVVDQKSEIEKIREQIQNIE